MAYWWVNQGTSYDEERGAGQLWAPLLTKGGATIRHWESMDLVERGDVVFHYANGAIRARGSVLTTSHSSVRLPGLPDDWGDDGRALDVRMVEASRPIALSEIAAATRLREPASGPFDRRGQVKQGYLFPVTHGLGESLEAAFGGRFDAVMGADAVRRRASSTGAPLRRRPTNRAIPEAPGDGFVLPRDPELRRRVERHAVDSILGDLARRFPAPDFNVVEMERNHRGFDIEVDRGLEPVLFVESKGTQRPAPWFLISDEEKLFSESNADRYELHVVYGINLDAGTHRDTVVVTGAVTPATHRLRPMTWAGRLGS